MTSCEVKFDQLDGRTHKGRKSNRRFKARMLRLKGLLRICELEKVDFEKGFRHNLGNGGRGIIPRSCHKAD